MDNNGMKGVFLSNYSDIAKKMVDYLQSVGIESAYYYDSTGKKIVDVPFEQYEFALEEGRKYACREDFGIDWVSIYSERRYPIASTDIGFGVLPHKLLKDESIAHYGNRELWFDDNYVPNSFFEYFDNMKRYLEVEKIIRSCHKYNDHEALRFSSLSINHDEQNQLLQEFIYDNGYGPFIKIYPITMTGELVEEPFQLKKH